MPGAAFSVPANIAEGSRKESNREFARFLQIAAGPAAELHYHVRFATDAALIPRSAGDALLAETARVRKMLFALLRRVRETMPHAHRAPTTEDLRRETRHHAPPTHDDRPTTIASQTGKLAHYPAPSVSARHA